MSRWGRSGRIEQGCHRSGATQPIMRPMSTSELPPLSPPSTVGSRPSIFDLSHEQFADWLEQHGERAYRANQIRRAIFANGVLDFASITTLPAALRLLLADEFSIAPSAVRRHLISSDGTEKLLLELGDRETLETVLMPEGDRRTVCVSSQVGCAMGCVFCASGLLGVKRNLTAGEMIEQVLRVTSLLPPNESLTNVVVMGLGEPMANLANLRRFLDSLTAADGFAMSPRRITVSTVGLPKGMREFASWGQPFNLAVSLHAPREELRTEIVPVNRSIGIEAVLDAADDYFEQTGRRVTYEYVLLAGRNDSAREASELVDLLRGRNAHVNLIPMNAVEQTGLSGSGQPATRAFAEQLESGGLNVTVRRRRGADIDAACGQLRLTESAADAPAGAPQ